MNFVTFIFLVITFGIWFPIVAGFFLAVGLLWIIVYPIACTVHWVYMRIKTGKWGYWNLIAPGQ